MKKFEEIKFNLPDGKAGIGELKGISTKNIEEHLKLYAGYVKNANLIGEKLGEMMQEGLEKNSYAISEIHRRFGFEYNGIRNHEIYFNSLSGGRKQLGENSKLKKEIEATWGFDTFMQIFKMTAMTRGLGWAMLYWDRKEKRLLPVWVDEHHIGQLQDCALILALDMWEHAYVADYQPSGKKQYVEDFFTNLNWEVVENNFKEAH